MTTVRPDPHERGVFWVESTSNPEQEHRVDITEDMPLGGCGCAHFVCVVHPMWKRTGQIHRCRHLEAVREYLFRKFQEHESN